MNKPTPAPQGAPGPGQNEPKRPLKGGLAEIRPAVPGRPQFALGVGYELVILNGQSIVDLRKDPHKTIRLVGHLSDEQAPRHILGIPGQNIDFKIMAGEYFLHLFNPAKPNAPIKTQMIGVSKPGGVQKLGAADWVAKDLVSLLELIELIRTARAATPSGEICKLPPGNTDWSNRNLRGEPFASLGESLTGLDLNGFNLNFADCTDADFRGSLVSTADFRRACLVGAKFDPDVTLLNLDRATIDHRTYLPLSRGERRMPAGTVHNCAFRLADAKYESIDAPYLTLKAFKRDRGEAPPPKIKVDPATIRDHETLFEFKDVRRLDLSDFRMSRAVWPRPLSTELHGEVLPPESNSKLIVAGNAEEILVREEQIPHLSLRAIPGPCKLTIIHTALHKRCFSSCYRMESFTDRENLRTDLERSLEVRLTPLAERDALAEVEKTIAVRRQDLSPDERLGPIDVRDLDWPQFDLTESPLQKINVSSKGLPNPIKISGSYFRCRFVGSDLSHSELDGNFEGVTFGPMVNEDITDERTPSARTPPEVVSLEGTKLTGNFTLARFADVNLSGALLTGSFREAEFVRCDLAGCTFNGDFTKADLRRIGVAEMQSIVQGTNLKLEGALVTSAQYDARPALLNGYQFIPKSSGDYGVLTLLPPGSAKP